MNNIYKFLKRYLVVITILITVSIVLSMSYSNFIVTSENHKVAEMYIGTLKYSMSIDGTNTNTLSVPNGETIIDVTINNENLIDTYYKLIYENNSNVTITYYEGYKLDNSNNISNSYDLPNDKLLNSGTKTLKLKIVNNSTTSKRIIFKVIGGFATNTLDDVTVPSEYTTIEKDTSTNTYFCTTTDTLTQGLKYVNGQYTYAYKQEGAYASSGLAWQDITSDGWGVQLTDKTSTNAVTSKVCTYINNKPIVSMYYMFYNSKATTLDVSNFNTSKVTNMSSMFWSSQATTLDVSDFNTSNVTTMSGMFYNSQATTLDVSNFNTSKVTSMGYMFSGSQATTLDVSNFDTSKVTNMNDMFYGSTNLKTIYGSSKFVTTAVTSSTNMFYGCTKLIGGAGTKYNSSYVDKTYARIDGGTSNPGYFTDVADKPKEPESFTTDSWETIAEAARTNNTSKYNVGDTRTIDMGTYGTHTLRIANKSTPSECSTAGFSQTACGFVLEFADIITTHTMNNPATNVGGWPASSMYTFVNNDIYNALPSELRNAIIDTTVVSGHGSKDTANFTSTDKLYLLAPGEVWSDWKTNSEAYYDTAKDLTRTLDYYTNIGVTISNNSGTIKKNGTNDDTWWWLRTAYSTNTSYFHFVRYSGDWINYDSSNTFGVAPAFRLG